MGRVFPARGFLRAAGDFLTGFVRVAECDDFLEDEGRSGGLLSGKFRDEDGGHVGEWKLVVRTGTGLPVARFKAIQLG